MSKFTVTSIPVLNAKERELKLEGAIDKYWVDIPDLGRCLVKADLRGAWVEKITVALAEEIGLPVAGCELVERADGLKMIASPNFIRDGAIEQSGEELLVNELGKNYLYAPEAILLAVDRANIQLPSDFTPTSPINTATDLLTGYLIYDSWIGNIDRHAKNWGIQQFLDGRKELLPTYDHGLSLGSRMPEDKLPLDLKDFSGSCRSSIQGRVGGPMNMNALTECLLELKAESAQYWIERIATVKRSSIEQIFERMPEGWLTSERAQFSVDLLVASQQRLLELPHLRITQATSDSKTFEPEYQSPIEPQIVIPEIAVIPDITVTPDLTLDIDLER